MARISVIGLGRVGLATGVAFATFGHDVTGYEIDPDKVEVISRGKQPYHETKLGKALKQVVKKGKFTATDIARQALARSAFYFICVGTPPLEDGSMDTSFLADAAKTLGKAIRDRRDFPIVAVKSTVVPGTIEDFILPAIVEASGLDGGDFGICMNPEFLREGTALEDTLKPDRIVIGSNEKRGGDRLNRLYSSFDSVRWRCDIKTAEMVKYASNSFLATKVTFANEIANICSLYGIDSDKVLEGMGLDSRINPRFLVPGVGFGGPCLPKDMKALILASEAAGYEPILLKNVLEFNDRQAVRVVDMLEAELRELRGKRIAVLGLAFKADTDDSRDSRAIPIIRELLKRGSHVVVHDPAASPSGLGGTMVVKGASTAREALGGADGCIIQTAWREYEGLSKDDFATMKRPVVVDGRRTLNPRGLPKGVIYRRIG